MPARAGDPTGNPASAGYERTARWTSFRGKHINSITNKEGGDQPRNTRRTDSAGSTGAGRSDLTIDLIGGNQVRGKLNIGGNKQTILIRARINSLSMPTDNKMKISDTSLETLRIPRCLPSWRQYMSMKPSQSNSKN
ncbi:hypothetical protein JTB14_034458 [Gonioctena quinquepunctata]|nr:hypothetical protein JTB14_034458 [Gonioctena quinquepunctata]